MLPHPLTKYRYTIWGLNVAGSGETSQRCVECLAEKVAKAVGGQPGDMAWIFEYADAIQFTRTPAGKEHLKLTHYSDESKDRLMEAMRDD